MQLDVFPADKEMSKTKKHHIFNTGIDIWRYFAHLVKL